MTDELANSTPQEAPAAPTDRARKRWLLPVIIGGVAVVVLGGVGIAYATISSQHTPTNTVSHYLDALIDGDAEGALDSLGDIPKDQRQLLSDSVFSQATDRITDYTITTETVDGEKATVTVEIEQGGEASTHDLALSAGDREMGLFTNWKVDPASLPTVQVSFSGPEGFGVAVNGEDVSAATAEASPMFPGTYEFEPISPSEMYATAPVSQTVTLDTVGEAVPIALSATLSEEGVAAAQAAFNAHLDQCLAATTIVPGNRCGYGMRPVPGSNYSNVRWTATERPQVDFPAWTEEKGWEVQLISSGDLRMDGDYTDSEGGGIVFVDVTTYTPKGGVTFDADGNAVYTSTYKDE